MRAIGVIPARYGSTRLEGKPLKDIGGKPMIQLVYEAAQRAQLLQAVYVATDDERIVRAVEQFGGNVRMTSPDHKTGTDRVAEVAARLERARIIVNLQGDEPEITGLALDHVVAITPALDRTVAGLEGAGLDLRRIREEPTPAGAPRQAFFRLGTTILEVVQEPAEATERAGGDRPAFFWGLAFVAPDLDATVAGLGDRVSEIRPAVQPGRRIATLRRSAGLSVPVALITPGR